jgi:hypothetical protein
MRARVSQTAVLSWVLIAVAIVVPLPALFGASGLSMEEGLLVVGGERVLDGAVPNRDFEHLYGPGGLWALAGAFAVLGVSFTVERVVGLAYRLLLLWAIHRITRRWGQGVAAGATIVAWVLLAPFGLLAYSWVGGLAFASAGLAVALDAGDRRWRWVLSGALAGVALLFRPDLVVAVGLGALLPLRRVGRPTRWRWVAGLGVAAVGYALHVARAGLGTVVSGIFTDPVVRLRAGRRLPVPPGWSDSGDYFARLARDLGQTDGLPGLPAAAQLAVQFWLVLAGVAVVLVVAWRRRDARLGALGLLTVGTVPQLLQRPSPNHLRFVGILVSVGLIVVVATWIRRPRISGAIAAGAVFGLLVLVAPHYVGRVSWQTFVEEPRERAGAIASNGDRDLPVGDATTRDQVEEVAAVLDAEADPGDRLFVGPVDLSRTNYSQTALYHLFPELEPASYHLEMNPGLANREGGRLADDLAGADWLLLTPLFDQWVEPNTSTDPGDPRPAAVVAEQFCEVHRTPTYVLMGRCDRR